MADSKTIHVRYQQAYLKRKRSGLSAVTAAWQGLSAAKPRPLTRP